MVKSDKLLKYLIYLILLTIFIFTSYNHELWRDEGHYIQIAKELSFLELIIHSRIEGLIPTHPTILKVLFPLFSNEIIALKFFNISFYALILFILINSRTPFFIIILFMLSYPIFFHGIINRYYITLLAPVSYLILIDNKKNLYENLSFFLLSISGIFGLFFLFSYIISNFKYELKRFSENKLIFLVIFLISCFSFFYYTFPYEGRNWNSIQINNSYEIFKSWYEFIFAHSYVHNIFRESNIAAEISISSIYSNFFSIISVLLIYFTFLTLYLKKETSLLIFSGSTFLIYLLFFSITSHHSFRHYFIFSAVIYLVNIKSLFINDKKFNFGTLKKIKNNRYIDYLVLSINFIILILSGFKFGEQITMSKVSNFYIILNFVLVFITAQNLYLKSSNKLSLSLMIIFSLYFIYFSIKGGNSYNSTFFISLLNLIVNFYFILFSKKKFDFLKLNILQKFNIQKKLLIIIFLTSSLTSISYAIKEKIIFSAILKIYPSI